MPNDRIDGALTGQAARIVAAYVSHNAVPAADLPQLIASVHGALSRLGDAPAAAQEAPAEQKAPAVPIRRSVTDDYLICLEDGKRFKSLKRHLRSRYGLTPEQYREKWGLPHDYPMVAPNYSAKRSRLAQEMGLGRNPA